MTLRHAAVTVLDGQSAADPVLKRPAGSYRALRETDKPWG
jgi:hypothetical protein